MPTLTLPAILDPARYVLALTPGTYSELVADNLGSTDYETDPALTQADQSGADLFALDQGVPGVTDALANLGDTQSAITQGNGAGIAAKLAGAQKATSGNLVDYQAVEQITVDQTNPENPNLPTNPTGGTGAEKMLGNPNTSGSAPDATAPCYHTEPLGAYAQGLNRGTVDVGFTVGLFATPSAPGYITAAQLVAASAPVFTPSYYGAGNGADSYALFLALDTSTPGTYKATIALQFDGLPTWYNLCVNYTVAP